MPRHTKAWLSFKGTESTNVGAWLMSAPTFTKAAYRGNGKTVIGRDGDVWVSDGAYDTMEIKAKLRCRMTRMDEVLAWLTGSGTLVFSWARDRSYQARIEKKIDFKYTVPGLNPIIECEVTFSCQPFRYIYPAVEEFEITESDTTFYNPGTAFSLPRVKITGSGDFTVTIGTQTLQFEDVSSGIIVDSEIMDALSADGTALANDKMTGTPWTIQPGANTVTWSATSPSAVTKVTILPRWRYY